MRINIYDAEILTDACELVTKEAEGITYYGLRFPLLTHESMRPPLHHDDDQSAVTFWVTRQRLKNLRLLMHQAACLLEDKE